MSTSPSAPFASPEAADRSARRLARFLIGAGVSHFLVPRFYEQIVPRWVGHEEAVVRWSGVVEIAAGALVAVPRTRRLGGWAALLTFIGVYPANIQMVVDAGRPHDAASAGAWVRLPLQLPMFAWAYRHTR